MNRPMTKNSLHLLRLLRTFQSIENKILKNNYAISNNLNCEIRWFGETPE